MTPSQNKPIAVFFTHGVSLKLWDQRGMFSREVRFYQALVEQTEEIWFFTYGHDDDVYKEQLGENIRIFPKRHHVPDILYGMLLPFCFWKDLRRVRLLRIHQMAGAIPALLAHWTLKKPLVVRCGYQWSQFLKKRTVSSLKQLVVFVWEWIVYQTAKAIIVTTQPDRDYVARRYKVKNQKIAIIPNYVDTDVFKPLPVEKEKNSICFVGRLDPQKNPLNLVEAMKGIDATLILYGDGMQYRELEKKASEINISLKLPGKIPNEQLPEKLNKCEIFVLPSLYEGNPKVLLEAMACGLPVIGTRVEGIETIIQDEITGMLCDTDADSLRIAIQNLLADKEKRDKIGRNAREWVIDHCSLPNAIQTELSIYETAHI